MKIVLPFHICISSMAIYTSTQCYNLPKTEKEEKDLYIYLLGSQVAHSFKAGSFYS